MGRLKKAQGTDSWGGGGKRGGGGGQGVATWENREGEVSRGKNSEPPL